MRSVYLSRSAAILGLFALLILPVKLFPQQESASSTPVGSETLPSAPEPVSVSSSDSSSDALLPFDQSTSNQQQPTTDKSQHDQAEEQLKAQEKQRVMGVMATFNTTTNRNALPLSPGQKFKLFFRSSTDPWPFLLASVVAGIGQARNSNPEWGQGAQGYAKRFGASYSDAFIGNFFGNAVLPVVLHEDPRFFQKGSGSVAKRILWAASSAFWCRRDNGTWGPNYANVGGNMIGAAISRVYYPASQRNATDVITDGLTVSVEGIAGAEVIEFWPDLVRHHKNKAKKKQDAAAAAAAKSGDQSQ